jgi:hypothetical protein
MREEVELYQADRTTWVGPVVNNLVIDLAKTPGLSIKASTTTFLQALFVVSNAVLRAWYVDHD